MLKILSLDTSTEMCSVALLMGAEVLARQTLAPQKHAELLLPMIDQLLAEAAISLQDLDAIAFGQGPGSFMGLRIGVGVVQGLAFGADKPVIAVSSLQCLAQAAYQAYGMTRVAAALDARMQAIYWGLYELDDRQLMQAMQVDALSKPEELQLAHADSFSAVGPAWHIYAEQCSLNFANTKAELYPVAAAMLPIARYRLETKQTSSAVEAEPCYLREQVTY